MIGCGHVQGLGVVCHLGTGTVRWEAGVVRVVVHGGAPSTGADPPGCE